MSCNLDLSRINNLITFKEGHAVPEWHAQVLTIDAQAQPLLHGISMSGNPISYPEARLRGIERDHRLIHALRDLHERLLQILPIRSGRPHRQC